MQEPRPTGIPLKRPSTWKETAQTLLGPWTQAVAGLAGAAELVGAFRPDDKLQEAGWRLVYGALQAAVDEAGAPLRTASGTGQRLTIDQLLQFGGEHVDLTTIEVPAKFLDQPKSLPLLTLIEPIVEAALIRQGLDEATAKQRAALLPGFFVAALADVWREDKRWLDAIEQLTNASPEKNARQERAWLFYTEKLERDLARPLFGEPRSLRELYQRPRGYWTEPGKSPQGNPDECRHVVDVATELTNWLDQSEASDALRVVSGGPGSGKSSLAKRWAVAMLRRTPLLPTLIVPLHRIRTFDLEDGVARFAHSEGFAKNPLGRDEGELRLLLILDGLDELDVDQQRGPAAAHQLVNGVIRLLEEAQGRDLRVLLAGREVLVAALRGFFGRPRQVLHVLGYLSGQQRRDILRERPGIRWDDPDRSLDIDQREDWWRAWTGASDDKARRLPAALSAENRLVELSDQPLLNHLLAIVHGDAATTINEQTSLNDVYAAVLGHVWRRSWGDNDQAALRPGQIPGLHPLTEDDLQRVFESIGLAVWQHGGGRSTTLARVTEIAAAEGLEEQLAGFAAVAKSTALDLLTAFYFRREGATETFELTHKTFGEYLAARRLLRLIGDLHDLLTSDDIDGREALRRWYRMTHAARITPEIVAFLEGELRVLAVEAVHRRRASLIRLFNHNLRTGMAHESVEGARQPANRREAQQFDASAEFALFAAVGACTEAIIHGTADLPIEEWRKRVRWSPAWPDHQLEARTSAWDLLRRLEAGTARDPFVRRFMQGLDLRCQVLRGDLAEVRLAFASATDSHFGRANLFRADLRNAELCRADFLGANLSGVDLRGTDLRRANLSGANLIGARFDGADLRNAHVRGAIMSAADLIDVERIGLDAHGPNFKDAKLQSVDFTHAELMGANFFHLDLTRAKLIAADLTRAELGEAVLSGAQLDHANLTGANVDGADLSGVDLRTAIGLTRLQLESALNVDGDRLPPELPEGSAEDELGPSFE